MFDVHEAVKELQMLRCKKRYTQNEVMNYHKCLNLLEEELCNGDCVIVDLDYFDSTSPEECYKAIQAAKQSVL